MYIDIKTEYTFPPCIWLLQLINVTSYYINFDVPKLDLLIKCVPLIHYDKLNSNHINFNSKMHRQVLTKMFFICAISLSMNYNKLVFLTFDHEYFLNRSQTFKSEIYFLQA